jgi:hypothetical protein
VTGQSLEERVRAELVLLRKEPLGLTPENMAEARHICDLLGAGDPLVAYTRLTHQILESDLELPVKAAAASLGLLAEGDTHLKRLTAFGEQIGLEQRQVRRYSDRGIGMLARLVATNWAVETVPQLAVVVMRVEAGWELHITAQHLAVVLMGALTVSTYIDDQISVDELHMRAQGDGRWRRLLPLHPLFVPDQGVETSVSVSWRGELWPKHSASFRGVHTDTVAESLGNRLMLRLRASTHSAAG